jgi:hypothetical protein
MPFTGTTRSDFIYRVAKDREKDLDPDTAALVEDLWAAFERGFCFAIKLRDTHTLHNLGELLRLDLMNDKEGIKEFNEDRRQKELDAQPDRMKLNAMTAMGIDNASFKTEPTT